MDLPPVGAERFNTIDDSIERKQTGPGLYPMEPKFLPRLPIMCYIHYAKNFTYFSSRRSHNNPHHHLTDEETEVK